MKNYTKHDIKNIYLKLMLGLSNITSENKERLSHYGEVLSKYEESSELTLELREKIKTILIKARQGLGSF